MDSPTVLLPLCIGGILAGLALLWRGFGGYRTASTIADTATSSIASLAAGEVRVTGRVEAAEVTLVSPLQSVPCVWYRSRVRTGGDDDRDLFSEERAIGFRVRDAEGGTIRVFPAGARIGAPTRFSAETGFMGERPAGLQLRSGGAFGAAVGPDGEAPLDREAAIAALLTVRPATPAGDLETDGDGPVALGSGRREYQEARIEIGDTVTVVGTALPFGHLRDPFGADRMDRAGDPLAGLEDPEVAADIAAARAAGSLLPPDEAWGNAAIPGFGIGRPASEPELDPGATPLPVVPAAELAEATARFAIDPDTLVVAAADESPLLIAEGAPDAAAAREQARFLQGLLGAMLAIGSAIVGAVILGGLNA